MSDNKTSENRDEARNDDGGSDDDDDDNSDDDDDGLDYQAESDFEDAAANLIQSLTTVPVSKETLDEIILNEEVPVTTSLFVSQGLPSSGKTTVLEKLIKELINLPTDPKLTFDDCIKRKKNDKCLSLYELGALGTTTSDRTVWSFATNRYGAVFAILCALAQRRGGFDNIINEQPTVADPEKNSFHMHVQWLKEKAANVYEHIKNDPHTIALIRDGITLTNVMDVGVNTALYEFLQMIVLYCRRHIRFAFFSLDRDPPDFNEKPYLSSDRYGDDSRTVLQLESRLAYLLGFATLGYDANPDDNAKTVMVATSEFATSNEMPDDTRKLIETAADKVKMDKFLTDWVVVNTKDEASIKNMADKFQNLVRHSKCHQVKLPLRWIVFRSLLTSLKSGDSKVFVLSKNFIVEQANCFNMNTDDVEKFLHSFTDFGSILYVPQCEPLKNIVIVDIWRFTQCLHELFYPSKGAPHAENLQKYGIISLESIKTILDHEAIEDFLHITTTLAMIAKISCPIDQKCLSLQKGQEYYYIPAARVKDRYTPSEEKEYVLLKQEKVDFPCSIQAGICHEIMKNEGFVLVATECPNVTRFKFDSSEMKQDSFEIEMVYHASQIRIQMSNNSDYDDDATVKACRAILTASNNCLQRIIDMKYVVSIPCCASSSSQKFHDFSSDSESTLCKECSDYSPHNCFRSCWSKAANLGDKKSCF